MGKSGPKPKKVVDTTWSSNLAYVVGLLASDGCLATVQPLIDLTSVDIEQLENYKKCLGIETKIGKKWSSKGRVAYRVQLKNVLFYNWLQTIGIMPNKSKTLGSVKIPNKYFFDFLRGLFDGDGCSYSYYDPRWKSSFMFYLSFTSASPLFLKWLRTHLKRQIGVSGHIVQSSGVGCLRFAKAESLKIIEKMYYSPTVVCLSRKRKKIKKTLETDNLTNIARVAELVYALG